MQPEQRKQFRLVSQYADDKQSSWLEQPVGGLVGGRVVGGGVGAVPVLNKRTGGATQRAATHRVSETGVRSRKKLGGQVGESANRTVKRVQGHGAMMGRSRGDDGWFLSFIWVGSRVGGGVETHLEAGCKVRNVGRPRCNTKLSILRRGSGSSCR